MVLKRPASAKTKSWRDVPYTRSGAEVGPRGLRMDQTKWKRSLPEILHASDKGIVQLLIQDGLLVDLRGKTCPRCEKGKLCGWVQKPGETIPKLRCNARKCQVYLNPHHLHPLFSEGYGVAGTALQTQAAVLLLKLNNISNSTTHRLMHQNHKAIEDMERRLIFLRKEYVEAKEKEIVFGNGVAWQDVEADETTFDKRSLTDVSELDDPKKTVEWEQWCGIVQRGKPETLVLERLKPVRTDARAPGPGAVRKVEWRPLADRWLKNRQVVLHTDSAKSYRLRVAGVLHDRVIHCKKRVKVRGKWKWQSPRYVKVVEHKIPGTKKKLRVKAGTQIIDRCWRFLKERLTLNQHTKAGSQLLKAKLRSAQYQYWHKNADMWTATGALCQWASGRFWSKK
eukprot:Skav207068  [mRNA]  locus=scaffold1909:117809:118993:- [translate_table: standard]